MAEDCEVLICGLGPVGQLLALLLGRRGIPVVGIDAAAEPYELPRAAVVDDEVLRIFQSAGILDQILADSQVQDEVSFVPRHGPKLTLLQPDGSIQGQHGLVSIHQPSMEQTIIAGAREQSTVELSWRRRLVDLEQQPDSVTATIEGDHGEREQIRARWMVGSDGGNSLVRQLLGIEFGGSTFRQRWLVVDVLVDRPLAKVRHPHFFGDPDRPIVCLPMSPGRHRWEWMVHPGEDEEPMLAHDSIRRRIEPWLEGESAKVERAVVYTFHHRTASRWRDGRVLLAGDAAHLMPPFAGQGFNSGARDAANLAWKLHACLSGAPESLLDSYEAERRPHVEAMSRLAVTMGKFIQTSNRRVALARDLLLRTLEISGFNRWGREHVKPVPAYGKGAFATAPARMAPGRNIGSQFPQPKVAAAVGAELTFDEIAGSGWAAVSTDHESARRLAGAGIRVLVPDRDFSDEERTATTWMERNGTSWVILRPDRFVYGLGSNAEELDLALAQLQRHLGRSFEGEPKQSRVGRSSA